MSYIGVLSWNGTRRVADALLSILLAARCAACEEVLNDPTRGPVCAHCWTTVRTITPPVCHTCGDPLPSWRVISRHASACPRCRRAPRAVARSRAVGPYETTLRAIIHALKYDGRRSLALPLAALMRSHGQDVLGDADCSGAGAAASGAPSADPRLQPGGRLGRASWAARHACGPDPIRWTV